MDLHRFHTHPVDMDVPGEYIEVKDLSRTFCLKYRSCVAHVMMHRETVHQIDSRGGAVVQMVVAVLHCAESCHAHQHRWIMDLHRFHTPCRYGCAWRIYIEVKDLSRTFV